MSSSTCVCAVQTVHVCVFYELLFATENPFVLRLLGYTVVAEHANSCTANGLWE